MSRHYLVVTEYELDSDDESKTRKSTDEFVTRDVAIHAAHDRLAKAGINGVDFDRHRTTLRVSFVEKEITEEVIENRVLWESGQQKEEEE